MLGSAESTAFCCLSPSSPGREQGTFNACPQHGQRQGSKKPRTHTHPHLSLLSTLATFAQTSAVFANQLSRCREHPSPGR